MVSFGSGFKLDVLFEFIILGNQYNVAETVNKDGGKKRLMLIFHLVRH